MKFEDLKVSHRTAKSLEDEYGYKEPTEVQRKAIPLIMEGRNLIVRSQTGTGKTSAFGIGLVERIVAGNTRKALILTPTRELAVQVCRELRPMCQANQLKVYAVYGGDSIMLQMKELAKRYEILVATPGRLLDLCNRGKVDLSEFDAIVLDEADLMLDMGFQRDVTRIMNSLPFEKLVLLFSATVDEGISDLVARYMPNPEMVAVGEKAVVSTITEEYIEVDHTTKLRKFIEVLNAHKGQKILVFVRMKSGVVSLLRKLERQGFENLGMLQGDMPQAKRSKVLARFKKGTVSTLIATNVAARGLHIDDVDLIVNYNEAEDAETHLHRVGRTGRMGASGKVVTLISTDEHPASRHAPIDMDEMKRLESSEPGVKRDWTGGRSGPSRHGRGRSYGRDSRREGRPGRRRDSGRSGKPYGSREGGKPYGDSRREGESREGRSSSYGGRGKPYGKDDENNYRRRRKGKPKNRKSRDGHKKKRRD